MNSEKDHPTIHLYGPRGLRQFVRTSLLLSQSELRFKYAVHELIPVTEQLEDKSKVRSVTKQSYCFMITMTLS